MGKKKLAIIDDSQNVTQNVLLSDSEESLTNVSSNESRDPSESETHQEDNQAIAQEVNEEKVASEEKKPTTKKAKQTKVSRKKARAQTRSKKYLEVKELVERTKNYKLSEAVELAQKSSYSKFKGSIEAHLNTNTKSLRGLVSLPFVSGQKLTILAFGKEAEDSGAKVGDEETIKQILGGKIDFDVLVTTPEWMPKLAAAARILGPRGMMPNPKSGTVTTDLKKTVEDLQNGKVEYKTEANGTVIHLKIGSVEQKPEELAANIKALFVTIGKSRISKITLAASMGPGVRVDLSSI